LNCAITRKLPKRYIYSRDKQIHSSLNLPTTLNQVIYLYKLTLYFLIILEEFFCEKRQKHIFTTFIFYLAIPHSTHHNPCFTNSRFHQTTKLRYVHASKFTNKRIIQYCRLQSIISLISGFFISGTPVPYKLEHYSISSGTLFHVTWNKITS